MKYLKRKKKIALYLSFRKKYTSNVKEIDLENKLPS